MNRIGAAPLEKSEFERALSMTSLTSLTPELTAERVKNSLLRDFATIWERVVLPTPGGPHNMNEERFPLDHITENTSLSDQMTLPHISVQIIRPHPFGKGRKHSASSYIVIIYHISFPNTQRLL